MSKADQAHEPTMEEILESIRRIISDDGTAPAPAEASADIEDDDGDPDATAEAAPQDAGEADDEAGEEMSVDDVDALFGDAEVAGDEDASAEEEMAAAEPDAAPEAPEPPESDEPDEADQEATGDIDFDAVGEEGDDAAAAAEPDDDILELTEEVSLEEAGALLGEDEAAGDEAAGDEAAGDEAVTLADNPFDENDDVAFAEDEDEAEAMDAMEEAMEAFAETPQPAPEPVPASASSRSHGDAAAAAEAPLLSGETNQAVASAFGSLENFVLSTHSRTLEDLVGDMLRPLLKSWLDTNLPPLVERLVREEIERVSRGRR